MFLEGTTRLKSNPLLSLLSYPCPSAHHQVQDHSPAQPELLRGDVITKIDQYDARDLMHIDAQNLFRNAGNQIKVTVRRDDKVALHQSAHPINGNPVAPLSPANFAQPYQPYAEPGQPAKPQLHQNFPPPDPTQLLPR